MGKNVRSLREKREQNQVQALEHDLLLVLVRRAGRIRILASEIAQLRAGNGVEVTITDEQVMLEFKASAATAPDEDAVPPTEPEAG